MAFHSDVFGCLGPVVFWCLRVVFICFHGFSDVFWCLGVVFLCLGVVFICFHGFSGIFFWPCKVGKVQVGWGLRIRRCVKRLAGLFSIF